MARQLFDTGLFSVLSAAGALGVGWKLAFYTGGTATPITTYNARTAGSANTNPVVAGSRGRMGQIWIEENQTIKWILTDESNGVEVTVDNYLIDPASPTVAAGLVTFLAGSAALPVANGGTGSTSAANARTALAVLGLAGGTMTGNIIRNAKGIHPYFNNSSMTGGQIYAQAAGADPTTNPGDWVFEW